MTLKWMKNGSVDRYSIAARMDKKEPVIMELADALDECVAALRYYADPLQGRLIAEDTLRKLGVEQ